MAKLDVKADGSTLGKLKYRVGAWRTTERIKAMSLDRLFAMRDMEGASRNRLVSFYYTAHALVRYIYVEKRPDISTLASSLVLGAPDLETGVGIDLSAARRAINALSADTARTGRLDKRRVATEQSKRLTGLIELQAVASEISIDPISPDEVRRTLAESTLRLHAAASEKLYARLLKNRSDDLDALLGKVRSLRLQGKREAAREQMQKAFELAPDQADTLLEGSAVATSGCIVERRPECFELWSDSVYVLRDVLDEQPDNFEAIYRLGLAHLFLGQPGEALGYLEIAWRRAPWSPRVNYFLGEAMRLLGDSRARWFLSNALRWSASEFFRQASRMALDEL